ncbi:hypothetical protein [Pseudomonas sp. NFIX28]|uniref:hypothetical protein n=1 Tax=Pseudomonas sp. NFIX28 TaxID=1566235 RepID=UPI00089A5A6E|nr:hypothetical protein [Pseudomonas sp. NFIX28]SDY32371.1 hypothetical protein SAMN03159453_00224 [Pseudomonas sp. NFIX28]
MFSHEGLGLMSLFIVLLLCALAMVIHPVHAFCSWLQRRKRGVSIEDAANKTKQYSR